MMDVLKKFFNKEDHLAHEVSDELKQQNKMKFVRLSAALVIMLGIGFVGGMNVGKVGASTFIANVPFIGDTLNPTPDTSADFTDFWKVWNILNDRFVQTHASTTAPTTKDKLHGAIAGMAASFGDPYTVYMPPDQAKAFQETISGEFGGLGIEIDVRDKRLTVIAPLKGSPAEKAGVMAGDAVIAIDGETTEGQPIDASIKKMRGKKGTSVTLKILRDETIQDITIVRDTIVVPTIESTYDKTSGVFTIAIYEFTATSANLFDKALIEFRNSGSKKLIVDLRGDPGGYLESAVAIASHFLPEGATVVTEDYKGKQKNTVHRSRGTGGIPSGTQVVILIDRGSASASEILAGALRDNDVATLIGTRSFGKGSVQELIDIGDGALKVTVARWLTPSGNSISDGGLKPDVEIDRTAEDFKADKDPQHDKAVEFLTKKK